MLHLLRPDARHTLKCCGVISRRKANWRSEAWLNVTEKKGIFESIQIILLPISPMWSKIRVNCRLNSSVSFTAESLKCSPMLKTFRGV